MLSQSGPTNQQGAENGGRRGEPDYTILLFRAQLRRGVISAAVRCSGWSCRQPRYLAQNRPKRGFNEAAISGWVGLEFRSNFIETGGAVRRHCRFIDRLGRSGKCGGTLQFFKSYPKCIATIASGPARIISDSRVQRPTFFAFGVVYLLLLIVDLSVITPTIPTLADGHRCPPKLPALLLAAKAPRPCSLPFVHG